MIKYGNKYLKLKDKRPYPNFKTTFTYNELIKEEEVGIKIEYPYVVIDIDLKNNDIDRVEQFLDILEDSDIEFGFMETKGGYHLWFKSEIPLLNQTNMNTLIGIKIDIKSWGKNSQARIKADGEYLHWHSMPEPSEVAYLPSILKVALADTPNWFSISRGDRHEVMLKSLFPLASSGFTPQEIYEAYKFINKNILESPLDTQDLKAMTIYNDKLKDTAFYKQSPTSKAKVLDTNAVALAIQRTSRFHISEEQVVWIYNQDKKLYTYDPMYVETEIHKLLPFLTKGQRAEIFAKIVLNLRIIGTTTKPLGKHEVVVKNGILDLETGDLSEHDDRIFNTTILPTPYNRRAKVVPKVDEVMNNVSCGNEDIVLLLYQMIGYTLCNHTDYQKAFILLGEGENGKSIIQEMMIQLVGNVNKSAVGLNGLKDPTKVAQLINKFANIVDEIGLKVEETENFKTIVSGMPVPVKFLYQNPFDVRLNTKLIFNANKLPGTKDKSKGYFRRWVIIPFNAVFNSDRADYDPNIKDKVLTKEAMEYLLFRSVEAYQKLVKDKKFVDCSEAAQSLQDYRSDLDSLYGWVSSLDDDELEGTLIEESFKDYQFWSMNNGYSRPIEYKAFRRDLPSKTEYKAKNTTRRGVQLYVWRKE